MTENLIGKYLLQKKLGISKMKIKTLAKQATTEYYASLNPATHNISVNEMRELAYSAKEAGIVIIPNEFVEKFAELIIYECAKGFSEKWEDGQYITRITHALLQHFEIEE